MKYPLFIASIVLNFILILVFAMHWQYIAMKYNVTYTPALTCQALNFAYTARYQKNADTLEKTIPQDSPNGFNASPEVAELIRQRVNIQDISQKIEALCNTDITAK